MPAAERSRLRRQLLADLHTAAQAYCDYRAASRYPPGSRPMRENADQDRPNDLVVSTDPMRLDGGGTDERVQVQTSQSRVYLGAGETAAFALRALDADGKPLALSVTGALARGLGPASQAGGAALAFADDGRGGFGGVLDPAQVGLTGFDGTIRTEVRYAVGGVAGTVLFDVIHTPQAPASWVGPVREALEDGLPVFLLALDVRQPGRYVVNGRIDDARGQPLALLNFNEVLVAGPNQVRLVASGKLLRDQEAELPLTLRDVDGYLLRDGVDPDRALLPRLEGKVADGAAHDLATLSDADWQGEERTRYLAEFGKDLAQARARLAAFDPAVALAPDDCAPPRKAASGAGGSVK
jgi:hypothetical protein